MKIRHALHDDTAEYDDAAQHITDNFPPEEHSEYADDADDADAHDHSDHRITEFFHPEEHGSSGHPEEVVEQRAPVYATISVRQPSR